MKFKVASGSARESLWHEPGLGSGICTRGKAKEQELNKQIAADSTKETFHSCCDYQSEIKILLIFPVHKREFCTVQWILHRGILMRFYVPCVPGSDRQWCSDLLRRLWRLKICQKPCKRLPLNFSTTSPTFLCVLPTSFGYIVNRCLSN